MPFCWSKSWWSQIGQKFENFVVYLFIANSNGVFKKKTLNWEGEFHNKVEKIGKKGLTHKNFRIFTISGHPIFLTKQDTFEKSSQKQSCSL